MENDYILDTGAILSRGIDLTAGGFSTTPSVIREIKMGRLARLISEFIDIIDVREPTTTSIAKVKEASKVSGNLPDLSDTDVDVIALALDTGGTIVTDDYSLQNVASYLSLKFIPCEKEGIRGHITWERRCSGCGAYVQSSICPICGHPVRRYHSRKRKV